MTAAETPERTCRDCGGPLHERGLMGPCLGSEADRDRFDRYQPTWECDDCGRRFSHTGRRAGWSPLAKPGAQAPND